MVPSQISLGCPLVKYFEDSRIKKGVLSIVKLSSHKNEKKNNNNADKNSDIMHKFVKKEKIFPIRLAQITSTHGTNR